MNLLSDIWFANVSLITILFHWWLCFLVHRVFDFNVVLLTFIAYASTVILNNAFSCRYHLSIVSGIGSEISLGVATDNSKISRVN